MIKLAALYKHWCTADSVKQFITAAVPVGSTTQIPGALLQAGQAHSCFMRLSVWYALLYVVIEGYNELKLNDPDIDELLTRSEYVDALRRFRNATFHYQADPVSDKLMTFLELADATDWARCLSKAFGLFFERELHVEEMLLKVTEEAQPQD